MNALNGLVLHSAMALAGRSRPLDIRTLVDATGSIAEKNLTEVVGEAMTGFERSMAALDDTRLSRTTFNTEQLWHDGEAEKFPRAVKVVKRPFKGFYLPGGMTHLDRYLSREVQLLLNRYEADRDGDRIHLLMVMTDGLNTGPDRHAMVQHYMEFVRQYAERCGGILGSRILVWYAGVGLTHDEHIQAATERYFSPREWVLHVPANVQGVSNMGSALVEAATVVYRGGPATLV